MKTRFLLGLAAAFAVQTGIVAAMVWSRVSVLETGQEITVRSTFVDPRDIFRGHYVRLDLTLEPFADPLPGIDETQGEGPFYVSLREGDGGFWTAKAVHATPPDGIPYLLADGVFPGGKGNPPRIWLPFDRYFADYDRPQELEDLRRDQKLGVILALDGKGGAVIAGLTVDGEKVYDEPLW